MGNTDDLFFRVEEEERNAVSNKDEQADAGFVGDNAVGVGQGEPFFPDDGDICTVDLFAVDEGIRRDVQGAGKGQAVAQDIVELVFGVEGEVEGVKRFRACSAFTGGDKVGNRFVAGESGEVQEVDAVDPGFYHRLITPPQFYRGMAFV